MPPPLRAAARLEIRYRPITDSDVPFVKALYASTRTEEVAATGWPPALQQAFLAQQHEAQHRHYRANYANAEWLIIEQRGTAIGRLYLEAGQDRILIIDISLLPETRGHGIGGAILADLIDAATAEGKELSLHVEVHNRARRLYERLGFKLIGEKGIYFEMARPAPGGR